MFWHPHHNFPATANILLIGAAPDPMVRVYGFSVSQIPSESLLYTIKSPLAKDTNTLLSKYLKIEYIHCILPDLITSYKIQDKQEATWSL